ncbi:hypothetical protein K493DRAFT_54907 [Basidiobolus meristosporus CBS 931.73]|uniref:Alpha-taxilin n=1 Tax=Basidiobolus meristosporus CBS 931.73 TaxID=1314790 RepID=A0A1Y1XZL5_9FUNG|nr:hypothetical protein K493DRAFT_54907 [Basidiobolus meristosporus CBS 931.73]|eukprot:ORX90926.1 hypothetical protein K493DRAFT_54907 [Basidiobolus meristosporus CBS 931.73]
MNSTVNTLIQDKIVQLESGLSVDEEQERLLAKELDQVRNELEGLVPQGSQEGSSFSALKDKYLTLFQAKFRLEQDQAKIHRKADLIGRERDSVKADLSKVSELKGKLENLCRELQRENKRIKEESLRIAQEEQSKRMEISGKFESAIQEIRVKMDQDSEENRKRAEENAALKEKFQSFLAQFDLSEQHHNSIIKSKNLEIQLLEAKINQHVESTAQEMAKAQAITIELSESIQRETELREQLTVYVEKFKQVEGTLSQSNEIFTTFRQEMEQLRKRTKKYEKENLLIKQKCEQMNRVILEMVEERARNQSDLAASKKKIGQLENLCRALQTERNDFQKKCELLETRQGEKPDEASDEAVDTLKGLLQKKAEFLRLSQALADEREALKTQLNPHPSTPDTPSGEVADGTVHKQPTLDVGPAYTDAQEALKGLCNMIEEISL